MRGLRTAVSFLTRVPVSEDRAGGSDLCASVPWFPVVGGLVGAAVAGAYSATLFVLPPLVAATVAVGSGVLLTGAFHEDGLADSADALGGGWSREEALRIMKDPTHGTYGVLAVVLSVLVRVTALAGLGRWAALALLPAAHALGRTGSVGLLAWARPATENGLGASYAGAVGRRQVAGAVVLGLAIGTGLLGAWLIGAALLVALGVGIVGRLALRKIGGITGDILGAAEQAGEILVLMLGTALVHSQVAALPWWR